MYIGLLMYRSIYIHKANNGENTPDADTEIEKEEDEHSDS